MPDLTEKEKKGLEYLASLEKWLECTYHNSPLKRKLHSNMSKAYSRWRKCDENQRS